MIKEIYNWFGHISIEIKYIFLIIFSVLILCSVAFKLVANKYNPANIQELIKRNNSWWGIAIGIVLVTTTPLIFGVLIMGYVSFVALREMYSISPLRASDRLALFIGYLSISVQYFFVYHNNFIGFLTFIPLGMYIFIPMTLISSQKTEKVGRSMSIIPSLLMLTIYMPSHLLMLKHFQFDGFSIGGNGLILYLIVLTAFNDVFQYTWGKLIGKHKILSIISPNKTMEGAIGGILTTALFGVLIRFITPFSIIEAFFISLLVGVIGFIGDAIISAIKRDLRIKDTGNILPGHGGAMDRMDSLVFTAPFFFHMVYYLANNQ